MNNAHIEQYLSYTHREDLMREVRANRSAKPTRTHQGRGFSASRLTGLFSLGLRRVQPGRATSP